MRKSRVIFPSEIRGERNRMQSAKGRKPKMEERKLKSSVNWQEALKRKGIQEIFGPKERQGDRGVEKTT
jgi:hypothetical protein